MNKKNTYFKLIFVLLFCHTSVFSQNLFDNQLDTNIIRVSKQNSEKLTDSTFNHGFFLSPYELMVGKFAGLRVTSVSGELGSEFSVLNRSYNSRTFNSPLVVIDGVLLPDAISADLTYINSTDIESIEFQRDADAMLLYGSDAKYGTIVIKTKHATKKIHVSYTSKASYSYLPKAIPVLSGDEYRNLVKQYYPNDTSVINSLGTENIDWQDKIYQSAYGFDNHVGISGTVKNIPFRFSAGNTNQEGLINSTSYKRNTATLSLSPTFLNDRLKINVNINANKSQNKYISNHFYWNIAKANPSKVSGHSPWYYLDFYENKFDLNNTTSNICVNYQSLAYPAFDFSAIYSNSSYLKTDYNTSNFSPTSIRKLKSSKSLKTNDFESKLNFTKTLSAHSSLLQNTTGFRFYQSDYSHFFLIDMNGVFQIDSVAGASYSLTDEMFSLYNNFKYSILDKYQISYRFDITLSNQFENKKRWYCSSILSVNWDIRKENFMANSQLISHFTLNYSFSLVNRNLLPNYVDFQNKFYSRKSINNLQLKLGLWKNNINQSFNVYFVNTYSSDIYPYIENYPILYKEFAGDIYLENRSKGFEYAVCVNIFNTSNLQWNISGNLSYINNKIIGVYNSNGDKFESHVNQWGLTLKEGYSPNTYYLAIQNYDNNGKPIEGSYKDLDNDPNTFDLATGKKSEPDFLMGISTSVNYKNLELAISGHSNLGYYVYNQIEASNSYFQNLRYGYNVTESATEANFISEHGESNYFVHNASFFRLDNISLSYQFKNLAKSRVNLMLAAFAQNVFTISNYKGIDPEKFDGVDNYQCPRSRTFGVELKFDF